MTSFPTYRWSQQQPQHKAAPRRPSADRTRRMASGRRSTTGGFDGMSAAFSLNAERRSRLRSAGTPLPSRHQNNMSWAKRWRCAQSPVPTPPLTSASPVPYAPSPGPGEQAASSGGSGGGGRGGSEGQSYLEKNGIKSKRDLIDRRSHTAGATRSKLTKAEGVLGGGWMGGGRPSSGDGSGLAGASIPAAAAAAAAPPPPPPQPASPPRHEEGSDDSLEEVRVTLNSKRMDEINGMVRERHNSWVKQNWVRQESSSTQQQQQQQQQQQSKPTRHDELLNMFRPKKAKEERAASAASSAAATASAAQHGAHAYGSRGASAGGGASGGGVGVPSSGGGGADKAYYGDYPPRPKSASAARTTDASAAGLGECESEAADREWLERVERERERAFGGGGGVNGGGSRSHVQSSASESSQEGDGGGAQDSHRRRTSDSPLARAVAPSPMPILDTPQHAEDATAAAAAEAEAEAQKAASTVQKLKSEGNAAYQCGRYSVAVMAYNKALDHDSHNVALHCNRAAAYLMLRYFDRCLADCQTAINVGPHYAKAHFRAGKALLLQCQPRAARKYYQTALQLVRQQNTGRQDMELIAMEERIETDLKAVAYVEQCRNYADQGRWEDALHAAEMAGEAVKEDAMQQLRLWALTYSDPVLARVELGHLASLTQRHIETTNEANQSYLQQADGPAPKLVGVNPMVLADQLTLLGRASFFSGHLYVSAAAQRLKEALSHVPDHKEATQLLRCVNAFEASNREASTYYRNGQWADAYQAYANCLHLDPANKKLKSVTFNNRAAALLMMGNAAEAVKDCTSAIAEDCTNVKAYARRSHAHQDLGNIDAALRDLELAAQLNPSYQQELREIQRKRDAIRSAAAAAAASANGGGGGGVPGHSENMYGMPGSRPGSRPSSAAGSRPSSAGASRRSSFHGGGGGGGGGGSGGGGGGGGGSGANSNFINNFPSAATHTSHHNYYKLMGLDRNATGAGVMRKYKELAMRHHPDRCKTAEARPMHEKMFKEIGEARTVLLDSELRSVYDLQLACNSLR